MDKEPYLDAGPVTCMQLAGLWTSYLTFSELDLCIQNYCNDENAWN